GTPDNETRYLVAVQREVTELRRLEAERLHYHANFNRRTGLPNRKYTLQLLEDALDRAERSDLDLAVVAVEIRDFATITQGMGEESGDALLDTLTFGLRNQLTGQPHFLGVAARGRIIAVLERLSEAEQHFTGLLHELLEGVNRELAIHRDQAPLASACAGAAL
ncbi:GGDEF domain-containing protein, partial [Halorhodospira sp. 9622]|uniref:GGDEF domain-containing protein n=1 Tax=Halorhodospira sp. 9622 TaxID=2899136 RepID=UPI001EE7F0E0